MNDDDDDIVMMLLLPMMTRIPLVMVVDSGAHNFQIFHVKPQLYALFVEEWRRMCVHTVNFTGTDPGLPSQPHHHHHQAVDVLLLLPHQGAFGGAENPLKVVSTTMHATEAAPCAVHCASLSLHPYTKEDAWRCRLVQ